jgi:hypothetical protein
VKIKVASFAMDSFLSVIKCSITCSCKAGDDECEEDYMFFMPLEPKPAPDKLRGFVASCKENAADLFAGSLEDVLAKNPEVFASEDTAPTLGDECPEITPEMAKGFRPITQEEHNKFVTPEPVVTPDPVIIPEVVEKPKAKAKAKPKAKDVIDVAHTETVATESLPVTYIDVMFDRSNKSMLVEIVDAIAVTNPDWKSNPAMLTSIKDALNAANGHWIYSRNGKVNQALVVAVADTSLTLGANKLPNPFFS